MALTHRLEALERDARAILAEMKALEPTCGHRVVMAAGRLAGVADEIAEVKQTLLGSRSSATWPTVKRTGEDGGER